MWTTVNNPPPPPPPPSELSPVGNILMEAVTKNWIETNSVYSTKCLQDYVNLRHNLLQHNPHEEHNENFSMLKSEQTKSTDADISNVYIKSNTYINKERLVNQSVKVCSDDITGKFVCFDDLFKASSQKHNLVSDSLNETENCNTTGTQNVDQIDYHYFNSPNMEFGDDEIYALPFGGTIEDNEKTAKSIYLSMKFHEQSSDLNPGRENQETIQEKEDKNIFKFSFNNISAQRFNCFSHFNYEQRDDHNLDISKNTEYVCSSELILETEGTHSNTVTSPSFGTERKHSKKNIVNASEDVKHQQTKYVNAYCKLFSQIEDSVEADHGRQGYIDSKETNFHINSKIREYEQSNKFKFIPKCKKQNFVLNKNIRGSYVELNSNKNINLEEANLLIESGKYNATSETAEEENIVQYHDKNVSLKSENCKENNKRKSSDINKLCDLIDRGNHLQNPYFKQNLSDNEFYTDSENISDFHLAGKPSNRNLQSKQHEQPNKYYEQQNIAKEGTVLKKYSTTKKLSDTNVACKKNALLGNKKQRTIPGMFLKTKMKLSSTNKNVNNEHFCKRKTIVQGGVRKKLKFNAPIRTLPDNQENTESEQFQVMKLNSETLLILVKKLSIQEVEKMAFTLIFSEGYTLLNKPPDNPKPMNSTPLGLVFYIRWANQSYEYFMLNPDLKTWEDCALPKNFINMILTNTYVKICFEAQTVFLFLLKMLDIDHSNAACCWYVLDPIVGCWLLDPDNTPQNFMQTYMILNGKEEMHVPSQYDNISQACYLLPFLCSTLDNLQQALIEVSLWSLFTELEMKIVPILAVMEACSICISRNSLQELSLMFDEHLTQIKKKAYTAAGKKFQINSAAELSQILYNDLQLHVENNITIRQTNFKKFKSTSESMLRLLENSHPLPSIVLEYRQIHKAKSTYIDGLLQYLNESDNLSTTWKQTGTATGRLTSSNPNLQAIPKQPIILTDHCQNEDNGVGKEIQIRALFISRTGYSFLAADFQNIEFRIFASYTRDEDLLKLFRKDGDIFQMFSQQWLGSDKHIDREKTKRIVYSVMYGVGASKLSEYIHVSTDEAEKIMNSFIGAFPSLNILKEKVTDQCKLTRSVRSLSGRHRLFPNISSENQALRSQSERQAINFLIQGSVADICKAAMLNCARKGNEMQLDVKLLLQVHDELIWEVADYQVNLFADIIKCAMEEAGNFWCKQFQLTLPLPVAITVGKNWADMKPLQCNEKK